MAISSAKPTRSISLPTRLHPNSQKIEAQLNKLKTNWESPISSGETPLGSEAIQSALANLVRLYDSTKELIQRGLRKSVEESLDGSIALLDACGAARDLVMRTKESVRSLQSSLRRKSVGDSSVENEINAYLSFRKTAKREIAKRVRALKAMETELVQTFSASSSSSSSLHEEEVVMMRELRIVAIFVFRRLFVFLSEPTTKASGWSLISKLVMSSDRCKGNKIFNEVGSVDISLESRKNNNRSKIDVEVVKKRLEALAGCVEGLESGLDSLFRCLIQHRVSLLNLLTP